MVGQEAAMHHTGGIAGNCNHVLQALAQHTHIWSHTHIAWTNRQGSAYDGGKEVTSAVLAALLAM
jgi:hypothetical protein